MIHCFNSYKGTIVIIKQVFNFDLFGFASIPIKEQLLFRMECDWLWLFCFNSYKGTIVMRWLYVYIIFTYASIPIKEQLLF